MTFEFEIGNTKYKGFGVVREAGKDIVAISLPNGVVQPFYKAADSFLDIGYIGNWLPFDGIGYDGRYFYKSRFLTYNGPYHKYGTAELKRVSQALEFCQIPPAAETGWIECNSWLKAHGAKIDEK